MSSLCCAVAVCRVAMPMHPKQNLAAANRYGAPLFLRKSNQRFSLPFLCSAIRVGAVPCHCYASLRFSFALPVCASQCRCSALLRRASHLIAAAPHCFALPRFAFASLSLALPLHCPASANPGRQCHSFASLLFAIPSPRCSVLLIAAAPPLHGSSPHSLCFADLLNASAWPSHAPPCLCASSQITAMPLQCKSLLRCAEPSHGKSNLSLAIA